jgi:uncharacterized protein YuzE
MRISYDPEVDALYIRFFDGPIEAITQRLTEDVAINYASDGRISGIEVLDASDYIFTDDVEKRIEVDNLLAVSSSFRQEANPGLALHEPPPDYDDTDGSR